MSSSAKGPSIAVCALWAVALAHAAWASARLPDRVASHFGLDGQPNGWMDRAAFLGLYLGICLFMGVVFLGIGALLRVLPAEQINLPNREHWLAPERVDDTLRAITVALGWYGAAMLVFMIATFHLAFMANLSAGSLPTGGFWVSLAAVAVSTAALLGWFSRRFPRPA